MTSDGFPKKLAYTSVEAGQLLGLSTETIGRMCRDGRLSRLAGVRKILIPTEELEGWVHNSACDGTVYGEHSPWIVARERKVSTKDQIVQSGGQLSQMQAVRELDALLGLS